MAATQERLPQNRLPWTTREKLCLASAVYSSGDQNWMSVSRTCVMMCGAAGNRPTDFFSQKSCSVQYNALLENAETPKRKKRLSETSSGGAASPASVETTTESIVRRLTEERMQELKADIRRQQEEYVTLTADIAAIESDNVSDEQVLQMWQAIEQEQEQQRIEEMKMENQIREREQRRQERNWRNAPSTSAAAAAAAAKSSAATTSATDMEVDDDQLPDSEGDKYPTLTSLPQASTTAEPQQQATSPLLSSLLKSPTSTAPPVLPSTSAAAGIAVTVGVAAGAATNVASGSVRTAAPTITTLLTSGTIPNPNQPAITLKSIPASEAAQLLARPISGPPSEALSVPPPSAQSLLSPSQSAPTLSMLLEKNKGSSPATSGSGAQSVLPAAELKGASITDCNNEEVPMDIEEDMAVSVVIPSPAAATNIAITAAGDTEEPDDRTEEQQLLEVFKNIGNMDELDIDVAGVIDDADADFLKGVDEDSPNDPTTTSAAISAAAPAVPEGLDYEAKLTAEIVSKKPRLTPVSEAAVAKSDTTVKEEAPIAAAQTPTKGTGTASSQQATSAQIIDDVEDVLPKTTTSKKVLETATASSDDSNDNIPLAEVASLENRQIEKIGASKNMLEDTVRSAENSADASANPEEVEEIEDDADVEEVAADDRVMPDQAEVLDDESDKLIEPPSVDSATKNHEDDSTAAEDDMTNHAPPAKNREERAGSIEHPSSNTPVLNAENEEKSLPASESSDVIVIPTDDDDDGSNGGEKPTKKGRRDSSEEPTEMGDSTEGEQGDLEQQQPSSEAGDGDELDTEEEEDSAAGAGSGGDGDGDGDYEHKHEAYVAGEEIEENNQPPTDANEQRSFDDKTLMSAVSTHPPPPAVNAASTTTISIMDTDDSSTTDISIQASRKEDRSIPPPTSVTLPTIKSNLPVGGHQSRRSQQDARASRQDSKTDEESSMNTSSSTPARTPMLRKLRDRDRSESPMIDDDMTTASDQFSTGGGIGGNCGPAGSHRSRRRYSSTPVIDSIPNSPASSDRGDDRETRLSKKSMLSLFNTLQHSKYAVAVQRALSDENNATAMRQKEVFLRAIDLSAIKRNIETGATRTALELQRDFMLMCQNALMFFRPQSPHHKAAVAFLHELRAVREFVPYPQQTVEPVGNVVNTITSNSRAEKDRDKDAPRMEGINVGGPIVSTSRSTSGGGGTTPVNSSGFKGRTASRKSQRNL